MITTVLFDMGGTLEDIWADDDSNRRAFENIHRILASHGLELPPEAIPDKVRAGWKRYDVYRTRTGEELKPEKLWCDYILADFELPREQLAPYCEELAHMWEVTHFYRVLRPGVKELLASLKAEGLHLGVISNTAALYQVFDSLEEYGIRDYFEDVTLSSVTGLRKPLTDIFRISLRQMRAKPEECVYVGDTVSRDIIGAKRAGFAAAIQIMSQLTREKDEDVDPRYQPDYRITEIADVLTVVRQLREGQA